MKYSLLLLFPSFSVIIYKLLYKYHSFILAHRVNFFIYLRNIKIYLYMIYVMNINTVII